MPRPARSNPLALAVLVCLYERPDAPLRGGPDPALQGQARERPAELRLALCGGESSEKRGFIRAGETVREGRRPERTVYEVTDDGISELTDWLTELLTVPTKEYPHFMAALSFLPALDIDDALDGLRSRALALEIRLAQLRGVLRAAKAPACPACSSSRPSTRSASWRPSSTSSRP